MLRGVYVGYYSSGAEMRGLSAVDIALWDLFGQACGLPIHQLLGGLCRDCIRTYNTCAGYTYVREQLDTVTGTWKAERWGTGPYEDFEAFLKRADDLAESLLAEGVTAMKIWPFDAYAEPTKGSYISAPDLDRALDPMIAVWPSWAGGLSRGILLRGLRQTGWRRASRMEERPRAEYHLCWAGRPQGDDLGRHRRGRAGR